MGWGISIQMSSMRECFASHQQGPVMHRQDSRESLASELPDHVNNPGLLARMPDQVTYRWVEDTCKNRSQGNFER